MGVYICKFKSYVQKNKELFKKGRLFRNNNKRPSGDDVELLLLTKTEKCLNPDYAITFYYGLKML